MTDATVRPPPAALTVFPGEIFQARSWPERVYPHPIYFNEAELFATEVRVAFKSVRKHTSEAVCASTSPESPPVM